MTVESEIASNEPIGGGEQQTPEIRQTDGTRRPLSPTEARVLRERQGGVRMNESDAQALDKIREQDDAARAQEEAARKAGEKSWEELEGRTSDDQAQQTAPLEVPGETPEQHVELVADFVEQLAPIAHQLNLPTGDVQDVVDFAVSLAVTDRSGVRLEDPQACATVLRSKYGSEEADRIIADAQTAVERLGAKMKSWLEETQLGNDPSVLYALAAYKRGDLRLSSEKAQAELDKMTRDPKSAYRDANAPGHKSAVARANLLYQRIAKAGAKKATGEAATKPAAKATNPKRESLERELKAAVAAPEYRKSGPGHAAAVSRVEALYRELYPGNRNENGEDE